MNPAQALQQVEISARRATYLIDHLRVENERLRAAITEARRSTHPASPAYRVLTYALGEHHRDAPVYELLTGFDEVDSP